MRVWAQARVFLRSSLDDSNVPQKENHCPRISREMTSSVYSGAFNGHLLGASRMPGTTCYSNFRLQHSVLTAESGWLVPSSPKSVVYLSSTHHKNRKGVLKHRLLGPTPSFSFHGFGMGLKILHFFQVAWLYCAAAPRDQL